MGSTSASQKRASVSAPAQAVPAQQAPSMSPPQPAVPAQQAPSMSPPQPAAPAQQAPQPPSIAPPQPQPQAPARFPMAATPAIAANSRTPPVRASQPPSATSMR